MPAPFQLELTVTVETALSVGGSGSSGVRADKTIQRDARGRPIIPASQLKGRWRHACEALARGAGAAVCRPPNPETTCPHHDGVPRSADGGPPRCLICHVFGSTWHASPLRFRDLVLEPDAVAGSEAQESAIRPGIGVDRRRGTVKDELLFFLESTRPGAAPSFVGRPAVEGQLDEGPALLLLAALRMIPSWGGGKSRGMGWAGSAASAQLDGRPLTLDGHGKEALAAWLEPHIV